jgi:hypothetical protein
MHSLMHGSAARASVCLAPPMQHVCAKKFMRKDNTMTFLTVARQQIAMQQVMQPWPKTTNPPLAPSRLRRQGFLETLLRLATSVLALLVVPPVLDGKNLPAQTLILQVAQPAQQQKPAAKPAQPREPAPEAIVEQPPASPPPISPANRPPNPARVSWDSRGLEIEASNSSLDQILHQVAADTGAKLEGLIQDQRVFGSYGPGPESDVLWKLLDGSGYNVLMIGGRDTNAPLKIVLSARSPANPQTAPNNQNRSNSEQLAPEPKPDYPPEPPRPPQIQNPFGNGEPPRDPLQFMQEILQRQQQIDQQQQQRDQQNNQQQ